ncbi:MAG: P22 coat - protein 5 family protein [Gammaproteobacteria bacterium]|nr:P22 coat - protein 5 family protein [Gammaproteobacteria bacterium]MCP5013826.1 P22 coat - protein 5 family protein [Ketobacter sp.]
MANTLTSLIPDAYAALDTVSREQVGFIPAVTMDATAARAAVGQTVRSPVAPAATATDVTPGVTPPDDGDQTIGNVSMTITKSRRVPIRWNGEQTRGVNNGGPGLSAIIQNQFAQAMRTLCNEVEADLAALHVNASRAYGTAGTTPFSTSGDFTDASKVLQILKDNGAPQSDNQLIIDTNAGANILGKQAEVNKQGDDSILRQGILRNMHGMAVRESAQIITSVAGTGASATTDTAGYAVGDTVITLDSAGTGTILAGDIITFAGDANKYLVVSGDADVSGGGTITLAAPGLRKAIAGSATNITVIAATARNMAFARSAIALATRAPALPEQGDSAVDRQLITDPRSGLTFEIAMYAQYRQMQYEISLAWGTKAVKTEHIALLLG